MDTDHFREYLSCRDRESLHAFRSARYEGVARFVKRRAPEDSDHEEIVDRIFDRAARVKVSPDELQDSNGLLRRIAQHVIRDVIRQDAARRAREEQVSKREVHYVADQTIDIDVTEAIASLPKPERLCTELLLTGMTSSEIAREIKRSERWVQIRMASAREKLAELLGEHRLSQLLPVFFALEGSGDSTAESSADPSSDRRRRRSSTNRPRRRQMSLVWRAVIGVSVAVVLGLLFWRPADKPEIQSPAVAATGSEEPVVVASTLPPRLESRSAIGDLFSGVKAQVAAVEWRSYLPTEEQLEEASRLSRSARYRFRVEDQERNRIDRGRLLLFRVTAPEDPRARDWAVLPNVGKFMEELTLETDDELEYVVEDVDKFEGALGVVVRSPGRPVEETYIIRPKVQEDLVVVLELDSSNPRTLTVRDAQTGKPIEQSRLVAKPIVPLLEPQSIREVVAVTDAQGEATFYGPVVGRHEIRVSAAGYYNATIPRTELHVDRTFWLHSKPEPKHGTLIVRVFDKDHAPWSGAKIGIGDSKTETVVVADERGEYRFNNMAPGRRQRVRLLEAMGQAESEHWAVEREVFVPSGATIGLSLGSPLAEASCRLRFVSEGKGLSGIPAVLHGPKVTRPKRTDPEGYLQLDNLSAGMYVMRYALGSTAWTLRQGIRIPTESSVIEVEVGAAVLFGKVTSFETRMFRLTLEGEGRVSDKRCDPDGRFVFRGVPPGDYILTAQQGIAGGILRRQISVRVEPGVQPGPVMLALDRVGFLQVKLVSEGVKSPRTVRVSYNPKGDRSKVVNVSRVYSGLRDLEFAGILDEGEYELLVEGFDKPFREEFRIDKGKTERIRLGVQH